MVSPSYKLALRGFVKSGIKHGVIIIDKDVPRKLHDEFNTLCVPS